MIDVFVGRAVTRLSLKWEIRGSNFEPVKSDTVLSMARQRCHRSTKEAVIFFHFIILTAFPAEPSFLCGKMAPYLSIGN